MTIDVSAELKKLASIIEKDRTDAIKAHRLLKSHHNKVVEAVNDLSASNDRNVETVEKAFEMYDAAIKALRDEIAELRTERKKGFWR